MSQLLEKYGLDVFDEHEIYINLLVEQEPMKIDFNFSDVKELIQNSFIVEREDQSIVVPNIEEDYEFTVRLDEINPEEFSIILQRFRSYNPSKGEKFLKSISMSSHPRLVSHFLKSFLEKFSNEGLLYGMIEVFFFKIGREVLSEDLSKLSDIEICERLYLPLPSDHLLYKINQGGWVDDDGVIHQYP